MSNKKKFGIRERLEWTTDSLRDWSVMGTVGKVIIPLAVLALFTLLTLGLALGVGDAEPTITALQFIIASFMLQVLIYFAVFLVFLVVSTVVELIRFAIIKICKEDYQLYFFIEFIERASFWLYLPYSVLIWVIAFLVARQTAEECDDRDIIITTNYHY